MFKIAVAIADHKKMMATAESMRAHYEEAVAENAKEQQQIGELRSGDMALDKSSARLEKGKMGRGRRRREKVG